MAACSSQGSEASSRRLGRTDPQVHSEHGVSDEYVDMQIRKGINVIQ